MGCAQRLLLYNLRILALMKLPKITIVVPSYNQGAFLEEALDSVLSQHYPRLELIVMDGGSQDESRSILKRYQLHLNYWESQPDKGQSHAINKGFRRATGQILTWLCSDDLLKPDALRAAAAYFQEHPEAGVVHGGCTMLENEVETRTTYGSGKVFPEDYFLFMAFPQPASFFRAELLKETGLLDENLHYGMDYDLFLRFALRTTFLPVKDIFAAYRLHQGSKTVSQREQFHQEYYLIFSKLIRSLELKTVREMLIRLDGYRAAASRYELPERQEEKGFWQRVVSRWIAHHMEMQFGYQDFAQVEKAGNELQQYAPDFWHEKPDLKRLWEAARYENASPTRRITLRLRRMFEH